jgi:hypothetical protein
LFGQADFQRYKLMQDFAHRVGDRLALIADTLQPLDFEALVKNGSIDVVTADARTGDPASISTARAGSVTPPARP